MNTLAGICQILAGYVGKGNLIARITRVVPDGVYCAFRIQGFWSHLPCLVLWNGSIAKGRHRSTSNGFSSIVLLRVAVKQRFDAIIAH